MAMAIVHLVAAMLIKAAILALYRRLFSPSRLANVLILGGFVLIVVFHIVGIVVLLVFCIPRAQDYPLGGWLSLQYATRWYQVDASITAASGVGGAVNDVYIMGVPLAVSWGIRTSKKRKIALSAILILASS